MYIITFELYGVQREICANNHNNLFALAMLLEQDDKVKEYTVASANSAVLKQSAFGWGDLYKWNEKSFEKRINE